MDHIFIYSSFDGHLGCFHVLAIVNSANTGVCVYVELEFSLDICPGVGLQDHMVTIILVFYSILFFACTGVFIAVCSFL